MSPTARPRAAYCSLKAGPLPRAHVLEPAALVVEQEQRLLVGHLRRVVLDHVVRVPVGEHQVEVAVVVVVEELQAPPAEQPRGLRDAVGVGHVLERLVAAVLVEREHLLIDVGDEQVLPAVLVEVGGIDAHARPRLAVGREAHLGRQADLLPLAAAAVHEQEVLHRVVGDEQVELPVVVQVGGDDAEALAEGALDVGALGDVGEGAVAVVVEQERGRRLEDARDAVVPASQLVVAAVHVGLRARTRRSCRRTGRAGRRCRSRTTPRSSSSRGRAVRPCR